MTGKHDEGDVEANAVAAAREALGKSSDPALRQLAAPLEAIEGRLRRQSKPLPLWPLVVFGAFVAVIVVVAVSYGLWLKSEALHVRDGYFVGRYASFGDALAPAAGALSALAVLAALASVYFQREELRLTRAELSEQVEHLAAAAKAQNRLAKAQEDLARAQVDANEATEVQTGVQAMTMQATAELAFVNAMVASMPHTVLISLQATLARHSGNPNDPVGSTVATLQRVRERADLSVAAMGQRGKRSRRGQDPGD